MKNKLIEYKKRLAKSHAQKWHAPLNEDGNHLSHTYSEQQRKQFAWWDDVSFKMGSQVVAIWWIHPRQHYCDLCENLAEKQISMPKNDTKHFELGEKIYTQVGKSRKKITAYVSSNHNNEQWQQYFAEKNQLHQHHLYHSDLIAKPFIFIKQYDWGLGVDLCLPIEVLNAHSANEMAQIAKHLLRHETTLAELYPDYTYTKTDWQRENPFQAA